MVSGMKACNLNHHLIWASTNRKLGPMPTVFASKATCPETCPLKENGCYAGCGPINIVWNAVTAAQRGKKWKAFLQDLRGMAAGTLWRFSVTGDLPGIGNRIDKGMLLELALANKGKRGYTYTHKPVEAGTFNGVRVSRQVADANLDAVRAANDAGFTVSLSANSPAQADRLAKHGLPMVSLVPMDTPKTFRTSGGLDGVICPAQELDEMTCYRCGYCQRAKHRLIGFRPHGRIGQVIEVINHAK